ncbi:MAG: hypothetical protein Q4C96_01345 [Planctomycetia bacterium]|nr:hypothetical protein [Planctomycetia bacterium]
MTSGSHKTPYSKSDSTHMSAKSLLPDLLFPGNWRKIPPVLWGVPSTGLPLPQKQKTLSHTNFEQISMLAILADEKNLENPSVKKFWGNGKKVLRLLYPSENALKNPNSSLLILAVARSLPRLALLDTFSQETAAVILETLQQISFDAVSLSPDTSALDYLLLAGELPLTLAFTFPELESAETHLAQAKNVIHETLSDYLDGAGMPHASLISLSRVLLSSWTRAKWMERGLLARMAEYPEELPVFTPFAREQYEWAVRCAMHLTRPDGTLVFSQEKNNTCFQTPALFAAAISVDEDLDDKNLAIMALPGASPEAVSKVQQEPLPDATNISPWSTISLMRGSWDPEESFCALQWDKIFTPLELGNLKTTLLSGEWKFDIRWDNEKLLPTETWSPVCNISNNEVDFLELELPLTCDFRIQRSVLLAKREGFILLADTVLPPEKLLKKISGRISTKEKKIPSPQKNPGLYYTSWIPKYPGIMLGENPESFETSLYTPREIKALALPLALPEWRKLAPKSEDFTSHNHMLEYRCFSKFPALYAPLFLDLYDERLHSALTWRHLTVAQKLQKVPPHIARGFRVMVADSQWLIYRSLTAAANRSVLGHNLTSEMFVATFDAEGKVEPILEIQ